jgi:branched-chain amino acid transport system permease protein
LYLVFAQLVLYGTATGCLYALIAVGFVLIWNTAAVVNFAQGEFAMISMFFAFTLHLVVGLPIWVALPVSVAATAVVGYLTERTAIHPVIGRNPMTVIMVTIGLQILFSNGARFIWGTHPLHFPALFGEETLKFAGLMVAPQSAAIVIVTGVVALGLHLMSQRTWFGKSLRAVAQDRETASLMGIRVGQVTALGFGLSTGIAGIAGVLMAPVVFISADVGLPLLVKSFIAAVIGGFGSYPGALIGGLLIGVLDNLAGFYISSEYRDLVSFGVLVIVLLYRPEGLFPHHH